MPRNPDCELCPLHEAAHSVCLWGQWRVYADDWQDQPVVMVLGQSPGRSEDAIGQPFIGPSGREIDAALKAAGVKRAYFTNAAKCSPEVNGLEIDRSHWAACSDYLDEELASVQPKYILALGNPAVQRLLGRGKVTEMAGKEVWSSRYQAWVVPALHPAAILRAQGKRPGWLADIHRFGRLVRGEIDPPPSVPPVRVDLCGTERSLYGLSRLLASEPRFTFDFEANVPDKKLPGWCDKRFRPYSIAFSFTGGEAYCVPIAHPDVDLAWARTALKWMRALRGYMTAPGGSRQPYGTAPEKGVHNLMYDALVWFRLTGHMPYIDMDTMPLLHLLDENAPKSLKWAGRAILGWPDWDIDARRYWPLETLYPYNGYDAAATVLIWERKQQELAEDGWLRQYWHELEMPKLRMLARMVANGVYVDRSRIARNLLAAWRRKQQADERVPINNPGSDSQVARWLYEEMKIPTTGVKKGKKHYSTDEETIKRLARAGYVGARLVLDCRRPRKEISTYYRPLGRATRISFDNRYHPDIRTTSVETGRLGSGFHTTPRPEESLARGEMPVRPIFSADPGYVLIQGDYSQIEARLCAWSAAGRPTQIQDINPAQANMLIAFAMGRDIYREQAAEGIFGPGQWVRWAEITKNQRQVMGKVPVLAMLYKISPAGLQEYAWKEYEIEWTIGQATQVWTAFHRLWPEFSRWHNLEETKLRNRGWARSPLGRIRRLPGALAGQHDDIRAGINAPIQSTASDITQMAGILCDEDIRAHPELDLRLVGDIHDALLVQAPISRAVAAARWLEVRMRQSVTVLRKLGLSVPPGLIQVEVAIGPWGEPWGELKKGKFSLTGANPDMVPAQLGLTAA